MKLRATEISLVKHLTPMEWEKRFHPDEMTATKISLDKLGRLDRLDRLGRRGKLSCSDEI